ncbi:MAG: dual specificity protein phosphatase family protein [Simkaniaceae bacterium]|nr:dual specificity protein phosphatase family protein [Simkaniaceae bacterium]
MVELVDQRGENRLFRGSIPRAEDGSFCYDELCHLLETDQPILISCLTYEREDEAAFIKTLARHFIGSDEIIPRKTLLGRGFYFWQVRAHMNPDEDFELMMQEFDGHRLDFPGLIDLIDQLMNSAKPITLYLHCRHGINRTGAVTIGYLMKYKKMPLEEAYERNLTFHPSHKHTYIYEPQNLLKFLRKYKLFAQ